MQQLNEKFLWCLAAPEENEGAVPRALVLPESAGSLNHLFLWTWPALKLPPTSEPGNRWFQEPALVNFALIWAGIVEWLQVAVTEWDAFESTPFPQVQITKLKYCKLLLEC